MRGFKNFKGSDARCPSIHFLFYDCGVVRGGGGELGFIDNRWQSWLAVVLNAFSTQIMYLIEVKI